MKRYTALLCIIMLIVTALCACGIKAPAASPDTDDVSKGTASPTDNVGITEKTYRLMNYPLQLEKEQGEVYLTSLTLRENCSMLTYLRSGDASESLDFPALTARTERGEEYVLSPVYVTEGTVCFDECDGLPMSDITEISCGGSTVFFTDLENHSSEVSGLYTDGLNRLSAMSYPELISYCLGSDGAYSEGAYGELAKRMVVNPEEFALRLLATAYPFGTDAVAFMATADVTGHFYDSYGFDGETKLEICTNICAACLLPDVQKTITCLENTDDPYYAQIASLLTGALTHVR
ncbi:MAG: hypothetical protein EOM14_04060 [Clostridia bacterium]|nr:hypothetical protein [Clostridia bacterium]